MDWVRAIGLACLFGWFIAGCIAMYSGSVLDILLWCFGKEYEAKILSKDSERGEDVDGSSTTAYYFKVQYVKDDKYKISTRISVDSNEYRKYSINSNVDIGYLSCFPCIKRLKEGKSISKICGCKDDGILKTIGVHMLILGWGAFWIYIAYEILTTPAYIGVLITIGWSIICWICCCCTTWIFCALKSSQQSYTMTSEWINNGGQQTQNDDPENPAQNDTGKDGDKQATETPDVTKGGYEY